MACQPRVCMHMRNTKYCIVEVPSKQAFTVQLKCNIACAREQLEGYTRVPLLQHASVLNITRESLRFNT